jgi:CxxC-x17-CxxC domain-containing protein
MSFQEKTIKCCDCDKTFVFTVEEHEQFQARGHTNEPKACPACRQARKSHQPGSTPSSSGTGARSYGNSAPRQMFPAKCASCAKDTMVPFEPRDGRPVYCSDCYSKVRPSR